MRESQVLFERRLRVAGKRITPQRRLVLAILAQAERHLDAHDVYERARRQDARFSLSTVYRTLSMLKEVGAVRELHLDGDQHHYELYDEDEHCHLVCLECGRVIEVANAAFADLVQAAGQAHGFQVASAQLELTGYCAECSSQRDGNLGTPS